MVGALNEVDDEHATATVEMEDSLPTTTMLVVQPPVVPPDKNNRRDQTRQQDSSSDLYTRVNRCSLEIGTTKKVVREIPHEKGGRRYGEKMNRRINRNFKMSSLRFIL
jgi:hypothetical protein